MGQASPSQASPSGSNGSRDPRALPRPGRQDRRREPLTLPGHRSGPPCRSPAQLALCPHKCGSVVREHIRCSRPSRRTQCAEVLRQDERDRSYWQAGPDAGDGDHRVRGQLLGVGSVEPPGSTVSRQWHAWGLVRVRCRPAGRGAGGGRVVGADPGRSVDGQVRWPGDVPAGVGGDDCPGAVHRLLRVAFLPSLAGRRLLPGHRRHRIRRGGPVRELLVPARASWPRGRHLRGWHGRHGDQCLDDGHAVSATLPPLRGDERDAVRRLAAEGPPEEEVGLAPFAAPQFSPGLSSPRAATTSVSLPTPIFPGVRA